MLKSLIFSSGFLSSVYSSPLLGDIFCGCEAGGCCDVTELDSNVESSFTYFDGTAENFTNYDDGNGGAIQYDLVVGERARTVKNLMILGDNDITCANVDAYAYSDEVNTGGWLATAVVSSLPVNPKACSVNFDSTMTRSVLNNGWNLMLAMKDPIESGSKIHILEDGFIEPSVLNTVFDITNLESTSVTDNSITVDFTIVHSAETDQTSCSLPDSAALTVGNCNFDVDVSSGVGSLLMQQDGPEGYDQCAKSTTTIDGKIKYDMDASLDFVLPSGCPDDRAKFDPDFNSIEFDIELDTSVSDTNGGNINQMIVELQTPIIDTCDDRLLPMAKIIFPVTVTSEKAIDEFTFVSTTLGSQPLVEHVTPVCWNDNDGHYCSGAFKTSECISMEYVEDLINKCRFRYLDVLDISVMATYTDATEGYQGLSDADAMRALDIYDCPTVKVQENVNQLYPVELEIIGDNLNNDISTSLSFLNLDDEATVGLEISDVVVSLNDPDSNELFLYHYDVFEKKTHMGASIHPYWSDGHFCRHSEDDTECASSFYDKDTATWNQWCEDNSGAGSKRFTSDGIVRDCDPISRTDTDRFIFNPSNWVFNRFGNTQGTMTVAVYAEVKACSSARLLRGLANDTESTQFVSLAKSFTLSTDNSTDSGSQGDSDTTTTTDDDEPMKWYVGIILGVVIVVSLGLLVGLCIWLRTRLSERSSASSASSYTPVRFVYH